MNKDTFSKLKVADIKALFETEQALEILSFAQDYLFNYPWATSID